MTDQKRGAWRNRIVGSGEQPASQFIANPYNWRTHPSSQAKALETALEEIGWIQEVVVNRRTGHLIDGHERILLALAQGDDTLVPYKEVDLSESEEQAMLLSLDPIAAMAGKDMGAIQALLDVVKDSGLGEAVNALAETIADELWVATGQLPGDQEETEADRLAEKWGTAAGQLWQAGRHRLLIGDSTDPEQVRRLFPDGTTFDLLLTDPPYGVSYGEPASETTHYAGQGRQDIEGDTDQDAGLIATKAFYNAARHARAGASFYVTAPAGPAQGALIEALEKAGWALHQKLAWVKDSFVFGRSDYKYRHEAILYGWKPDGKHRFFGPNNADSVWEFARPKRSPLHPTTKPVPLFARAIDYSTRPGEKIFDPFAGSGTTYIACERMGRAAVGMVPDQDAPPSDPDKKRTATGMEKVPKYAAVILERLDQEGLPPELVED